MAISISRVKLKVQSARTYKRKYLSLCYLKEQNDKKKSGQTHSRHCVVQWRIEERERPFSAARKFNWILYNLRQMENERTRRVSIYTYIYRGRVVNEAENECNYTLGAGGLAIARSFGGRERALNFN